MQHDAMRILFLSSREVNKMSNGGELCTNRNYLSFCAVAGKKNVTVLNLMNNESRNFFYPIKKRLNYFKGFSEGVTRSVLTRILTLSKSHDIVFIDTSLYGIIAKYLKKRGYKGKIICFFHNVETTIKWQRTKISPKRFAEFVLAFLNEKVALRFADEIVALNNRDLSALKKKYPFRKGHVIPISLLDKKICISDGKTSVPPVFLFPGNNWYANIHGIKWFIKNVLDHIDIVLQITGKGMEKYRKQFEHPKVEFLGFVEDLEKVICNADYILLPIFYGSGMKVKTCEALRYGKNIIGTEEAFVGYDLDHKKVGALCNTQDDFIREIRRITSCKINRFNEYSRRIFLEYYSFDATLEKFRILVN